MAPWPLFAVVYHALRSGNGDADWLKAISIAILFILFLPALAGIGGLSVQILAVGTLSVVFYLSRSQD